MSHFDIVIVGAGIAGASVAAKLAPHCKILLIEAETQPGYHATGRSAAFWSQSYGGSAIQPLTLASKDFLAHPPADFSEKSFLRPRGALHIGRAADAHLAQAMQDEFSASGLELQSQNPAQIQSAIHGLRTGWDIGLWEEDTADIDVGALHIAYLRSAKNAGVQIRCNAKLNRASWADSAWSLETTGGHFKTKTLVNAAGAWASDVAKAAGVNPIAIQPYRRTMLQIEVAPYASPNLPLVMALDGSFYFKSETAGRVWLSPHDETNSPPCDAAPEELDVALALDRFAQVVDWDIVRIEAKWAGLRSFAPDRLPVLGRDSGNPAFYWLAGQGGFGIQTAPAIAEMVAADLCHACAAPDELDIKRFRPDRF